MQICEEQLLNITAEAGLRQRQRMETEGVERAAKPACIGTIRIREST